MKCLLISPPSSMLIRGWADGNLDQAQPPAARGARWLPPPLGILYLAASLEAVPGVSVKVLGAQAATPEQLRQKIEEYQPDLVGISCMVFTLLDALQTARTVRALVPHAKIVFGGIHPTLSPQETIAFREVDYLVRGEGELALPSLLAALRAGQAVEALPGIVSKRTPCPEAVAPQLVADLDELRPPAWHLVEGLAAAVAQDPYMPIHSSRGCVGACSYCNTKTYVRRIRMHSAAYIFELMRTMAAEYGAPGFFFWDDCFTLNKKRVLELCHLITQNNFKLPWKCFSRTDTVDDEMLRAMAQAGCCSMDFGIESGDPRIQKLIRKNLDLAKVKRVISAAYAYGIKTNAFFMIGLPGEGRLELKRTAGLIKTLPLHFISLGIFTPLPQTDAYLEGLRSGIIAQDYWKDFAEKPKLDFKLPFWNENFSDAELRYWHRKIRRDFFFRFIYIWRGLRLLIRRGQFRLGLKWYLERIQESLRA